MKFLVVFYSRKGTTKIIGEIISDEIHSEHEEIIDTKKRKGIIGFLISGKDATLKKLANIKEIQKNPELYDFFIVGTPVWNRRMTPAIRTYIIEQKHNIKYVAFFCTEGSSGGLRVFDNMAKLCEKTPISTLEITKKDIKEESHLEKIQKFIQELQID
ncbi:MAG: flavodoxin family protein [Promethearchaeota archaeon]